MPCLLMRVHETASVAGGSRGQLPHAELFRRSSEIFAPEIGWDGIGCGGMARECDDMWRAVGWGGVVRSGMPWVEGLCALCVVVVVQCALWCRGVAF